MLGFRVWDPDYKQFKCERYYTVSIDGEIGYFDEEGIFVFLEDRFIPMQSTGMQDGVGKMIYEGDILKVYERIFDFKEWIEREPSIVLVENVSHFFMKIPNLYWPHQTALEIVGNRFENPQLLEKI